MGKTIVLCSDGTGNSATGVPSNVRRLYDLLLQDGRTQIALYDPGVGSERREPGQRLLPFWRRHLASLCFGSGVADNLRQLYACLVEQYNPGDTVVLVGFSRGAFTVRALAGLVHVCGLVRRPHRDRVDAAVRLYETSESRITAERRRLGLPRVFAGGDTDHAAFDPEAGAFRARYSQPCTVALLALWDTVKAYGWIRPRSFPALRHNPDVRDVRHAVSLDERRALFSVTGWGDRHPGVQEVWFAGDHSDVGGGHAEGNTALADASLRWMLGEVVAAGVRLTTDTDPQIAALEVRSRDAVRVAPRDLWGRGYALLDGLPRVDLQNDRYPPRRVLRLLWSRGTRHPGDHAFEGRVFVHRSVFARLESGERRYAAARLLQSGGGAGHARQVVPVDDVQITLSTD